MMAHTSPASLALTILALFGSSILAAPVASDTAIDHRHEERQFTVGGWEVVCNNNVSTIGCVRDFDTRCEGERLRTSYYPLCGVNCRCKPILICEICKGEEGDEGGKTEATATTTASATTDAAAAAAAAAAQ